MKINKSDCIGLALAYLGLIFFLSWGCWSINEHNMAYSDLGGFIIKIFGI